MKNILKIICVAACLSSIDSEAQQFNGFTLIATQNANSAYLMDTNQTTVKTWSGLSSSTGYSAYLEPGGILTRTAKGTSPAGAPGGPVCGKIQKHDYNGNLIWDYTLSGNDFVSHHDIQPMPNGNVLAIVYEKKSASDVSAAGGNQSITMWPDKIVEIQPTGLNTGTVVWEWKVWDHLVQNVSPNKANYQTSIIDHPELLNINYKQTSDWLHANGVDYNPILDQVIFSSHNLNEWYIIDHSTTTAEAAGHTGGNSGKGGDFLYRWGNPTAYGASGSTILNVTHDAHWIPEGVPNAGRIAGINNGGQANPQRTTVDFVTTPTNNYVYDHVAGQAFQPTSYTDRIVCNGYTGNMGSSQQLPNGNHLICIAQSGKVYEINSAGTQLWTKSVGGTAKAYKYDSCYIFNTPPAIPTVTINGNSLTSTAATTYQWYLNGVLINGATSMTYNPTQSGIYVVRITDANGCIYRYSKGVKYTANPNHISERNLNNEIAIYPNPTQDYISINDNDVLGNEFTILVADHFGNIVASASNVKKINVAHLSNGIYILQIKSKNGIVDKRFSIIK